MMRSRGQVPFVFDSANRGYQIDEDDDGMITIEEFEAQAKLVEQYCGQLGSPWKT